MKSNSKTPATAYFFAAFAASFIGVLVFVGLTYLLPRMRSSTVYEYVAPVVPTAGANTKQPPTSVYIAKINKRLPVQASVVRGNDWDLYSNAVAWLATSSIPGEGNVILYAHDWQRLWGDLYKLRPGDIVEVGQNEKIWSYKVTESRAVLPSDVQAVLSEENRLTMFTCEGSFDQKRRVVYATPL